MEDEKKMLNEVPENNIEELDDDQLENIAGGREKKPEEYIKCPHCGQKTFAWGIECEHCGTEL